MFLHRISLSAIVINQKKVKIKKQTLYVYMQAYVEKASSFQ